jgi:hypothetical protein
MSYYVGATGEYIWEELLENNTSNVVIANHINFDAGPLTDAIQQTITDSLGTAVGELIQTPTQVASATGVGVISLTALGLLSYYKLNRTAVQDVDSMVYSADYASILTPGMFDDRVRIRYDTNWFSNSFYYVGGVKKGELLTYRPEQGSNILNLNATNIKLGTIDNARLPTNYGTKLGIGTSPVATADLHIYDATNANICLETGATGTASIEFQRGTINDVNVDYKIINNSGRFSILSQDEVNLYTATTSEIIRMTRGQITIFKNAQIDGNVGIGITPNATYKLDILGDTQTIGNVGIGTAPNALYKVEILGNTRTMGRVGIGVTSIGTTYDLDVLGSGRISGGLTTNTLFTAGLIYANAGIQIPTGQTLSLVGTANISANTMTTTGLISANNITASGLITANAGITIPAGQTLTLSGTTSAITASGLITANAGITIPTGQILTLAGTANISANTMTTSGLITANNGITIPVGKTLTSSGDISANTMTASGLITANGGITTSSTGLITANNGIVIPAGKSLTIAGVPVSASMILSQGMVVQMKHKTYGEMDVKNNTGWDAINDDIVNGFVVAITPSNTASKILVNMIAHIGTDPTSDSRWWGIKLYRRIGAGAWTEITGANGTELGGASATAGTPVWVSHNLGSETSLYQYFVANVTGAYLDAPNTTSIVYYTAYWNQRLGEGASAPSGNIYLNRAVSQGDGYRPAPSSSWTATEIWDLGTPYTQPSGDTTITITSGNVGVGVAPNASYKLNVGGTISAIVANPIGATDLLNMRYDANWGLRLQQNYTGAGNIQYDFIHRYSAVDYNSLTFKGGSVGIGNTNPTGTLCLGNSSLAGSDGFLLIGKNNGAGGARTQRIGYNANFDLTIGDYGGGTGPWIEAFKISYACPNGAFFINGSGQTVATYNLYANSDLLVAGTSYQRNTYIYSGSEWGSIGLYFATPFTGSTSSATKSAIIAEAQGTYSRHNLAFCLNGTASNSENVSTANVYMRFNYGNYIDIYKQFRVFNEMYGGFYSVTNSYTDYLCVQGDYGGNNAYGERWIRVAFGSFTAFHRCYTDDEIYNNDTQENIDLFKNDYMGRVVIATGKIKSDFSRITKAPKDPNAPDGADDPNDPNNKAPKENTEWYSEIDKDGITAEDAVPIVRLSRKKKDKRVFGVLGAPKRNTNNPNRLIVNSVGEGGICVSNTNGNIENGDFLQSSDLLGYAEKQDDDLLHNYTIGKATIDCNFELDSPYYQCKEIENGVRVAFIACSYHCG